MEFKRKIGKHLRTIRQEENKNLIDRGLISTHKFYKYFIDFFSGNSSRTASLSYLRYLNMEKKLLGYKYHFVSIEELVKWTEEWTKSFVRSYDLIVGIPRSGLFVANLVALKLAKPLSASDIVPDKIWISSNMVQPKEVKSILLVDDSITSGRTLQKHYEHLCSIFPNVRIDKGVVIVAEDTKDLVDSYYVSVPRPRIFEWNMLRAKKGTLGVDLDGVICEEPPMGLDGNKDAYRKWILSAKPYLIPTFNIDFILSNRLEKYRKDTEEWLQKHGVQFKELILWDIESKSDWKGRKAQHKIEHLTKLKPDLFWESSPGEARQIWEATKIPVLCVGEKRILS